MTYQHHEVQDQIAAVLLAMERSSEEVCPAVRAAINHLAHKASVTTFGRVGEVVAFEPFSHYVTDAVGDEVPTQVEVMLFGVYGIRDDGSLRVLSRAIVKPA